MKRITQKKRMILALTRLSKQARNRPLGQIDKECINCLRDCCRNILTGEIRLSPFDKSRLSQYKSKIREIAQRKTGTGKVRKHLQFGGFFQALIPILTGLIGTIFGR